MKNRTIVTILTITVILGLFAAAGSAMAGPAEQGEVSSAATVNSKMSYQGRLTNPGGEPLNGNFNLNFELYDAASGGTKVWEQMKDSVQVQGGLFTVELDVDPYKFNGEGLWLAITVNGQLLEPRQEITPVPYAFSLRPGAVISSPGPTNLVVENLAGGYAVQGWSRNNIGLAGFSLSGGITDWPAGQHGVYGRGEGTGVYGVGGWAGVYGTGENHGVKGESINGDGLRGITTDGYGVYGTSTNGYGGFFSSQADHYDLALGGAVGRINTDPGNENSNLYLSSNNDITAKLDNDSGENGVFRIKNSGGNDVFTVDEQGNYNATGTKSAVVETATYGRRLLYTVESSGVWFEDVGTAALVNGKALVAFEPIFAETVNTDVDYHVFVTPLSQQPVLLFVSAKTATAFTVQGVTLDGQPADCAFDYRIIAKRLAYERVRMDKATMLQEGEP